MGSYTASRALSGVQPIFHHGGMVAAFSKFTYTVAPSASDTVALLTVPAFQTMIDVILATDQLDNSSTAAIKFSVGETGPTTSVARFINSVAQTTSAALTPTHMNVAAGMGWQYTTATLLTLTVSAGPQTGATSGTVYFTAIYANDAITASSEGTELP